MRARPVDRPRERPRPRRRDAEDLRLWRRLADEALADELLLRIVRCLWAAGWAAPAAMPPRARSQRLRIARVDGTTRMRRSCLVDCVVHRPGPQARRWHAWGGYFDVVGGAVYREHAKAAGRDALEAFLAANTGRGGGVAGTDELDALARPGDPRSAPLLLAGARDAALPYAQRRALHARDGARGAWRRRAAGACTAADSAWSWQATWWAAVFVGSAAAAGVRTPQPGHVCRLPAAPETPRMPAVREPGASAHCGG
jgi:hypothetical protein